MEDVYQYLGQWGPYQWRLFLLLLLPILSKGMQTMMAVIIFHVPHHRCRIPGWPEDSYVIQNKSHGVAVNQSIPLGDSSQDPGYSQCSFFSGWNHSSDVSSDVSNPTDDSRQLQPCHAWVYDTSEVDTSVITQFDLVCDRNTYRAHLNMTFLLGLMFGALVSGYLCDWCGRKTVFCISNSICLVVGVASAFAPIIEVFLVFRFIMGAMGSAIYLSAFVLVVELVGPEKRTKAASLLTMVWLLGPFLIAGLSYLVGQWQYLQIISVAPLVFCLGHWWLLPESPRWLLTKKKTEAALKAIQKVASVNSIPFSPSQDIVVKLQTGLEAEGKHKLQILKNIRLIFKNRKMVVVTLIVIFNWCVVTMTYYGLSLNVGNLGGNLRVNFLLSSTVELIGYVLGWVLLDRWGRKRSHCCFMLIAGLACLATMLTVSLGGKRLEWATIGLAMLGKLGISASYTAVYLISAELFPTVIRNVAMAISSAWGRVGSTVSPYIADLGLYVGGRFGRAVPLVIFGGLAVLAGLLALYLPETLHRPLPDTLEEAVHFTQSGKKKGSSGRENQAYQDETEQTSSGPERCSQVSEKP